MIPFLSPFILRLLGGRFKWLADILAIALLIGAVWGAWSLWLHFHDKDVIAKHETEVQADVVDATSEAGAAADAEAAKYETEFGKRQTQDKKDIDDAKVSGSSPFDSWNVDRPAVSGGVQPARADRKAPR